ncbi:MAG TPA: hypothetical protein VGN32_05195 [Ktedonobacterales bacterium]|nr:hypothetical protein [Ktedonobacterales bacterium]
MNEPSSIHDQSVDFDADHSQDALADQSQGTDQSADSHADDSQDAHAPAAPVTEQRLATGEVIHVRPGNLAAAKDALAAEHAAERAAEEQGTDARIDPEKFRSVVPPPPPDAATPPEDSD